MTRTCPLNGRREALQWALVSAALLGTGCSGLLPKPAAAPTRYTLDSATPEAASNATPNATPNAAPPATAAAPAGAPSIVVALPTAAAGFDSTRMVYLLRPQALQAYAYAEWVDTPARLMAPLLVQALQRTGAFRAVLQSPSSAIGGLRLETELIRLQHEHTQTPSAVRLTLRTVLLEVATRQPLATREFDVRVPAPSDDPAGCVAATGTATRQLLAELAAYVAASSAGVRRDP